MTLEILTALFGRMLLLNLGLYLLSALMIFALRDWITRFQARLFAMEPADIRRILYAWLGAYKLGIILLCLVPWLALRLTA